MKNKKWTIEDDLHVIEMILSSYKTNDFTGG